MRILSCHENKGVVTASANPEGSGQNRPFFHINRTFDSFLAVCNVHSSPNWLKRSSTSLLATTPVLGPDSKRKPSSFTVHSCPPALVFFSISKTFTPFSFNKKVVTSPVIPAPITITSTFVSIHILYQIRQVLKMISQIRHALTDQTQPPHSL
jgi:hypothetical protein